jgi:hypothetical protein
MGMELMTYSGFILIHKFIHLLFFLIYVKKNLKQLILQDEGSKWQWMEMNPLANWWDQALNTQFLQLLAHYTLILLPTFLNNFLYKL